VLSIQSIMLVALGFLSAALLALTIAPAFWSRAVRLTTQRIKERLPVTESEVRADKDRLRAEFAMTVHRLESKIEQADEKRARHLIDLNRRDAAISRLESDVTTLRSTVEEHENARRVLEHTVSDQLPRVETKLGEARTLLATRDAEINDLAGATRRQQDALEEARGINAQQAAEIERLTTSLTVRGGRNQDTLTDTDVSGEVALRGELEALRAKARDQAALIARLQQSTAQRIVEQPALAVQGVGVALNGRGTGDASHPNLMAVLPPDELRANLERDLRAVRSKSEDQAAEIKTLSAELSALRSAEAANTPDSKVALRARLTGLQVQSDQQGEQIRKLRAELAAANERLALQGAHFMEQMRRLGAGAQPANGAARKVEAVAPSRPSLAERVTNSRGPSLATDAAPAETPDDTAMPAAKASGRLADRISSLGKA
jgi:chromosome segregation ATPase